jgi:hypothetical protein
VKTTSTSKSRLTAIKTPPPDFLELLTQSERVDVINDLGVLVDNKMIFVNHIESIVLKSARMLGFKKRISREFSDAYTYKTLYVAFAGQVWSMHRACGRLIKGLFCEN